MTTTNPHPFQWKSNAYLALRDVDVAQCLDLATSSEGCASTAAVKQFALAASATACLPASCRRAWSTLASICA